MADQQNVNMPAGAGNDGDDTKTRKTVKVSAGFPGSAPKIDLNAAGTIPPAGADEQTLTRRTMKLRNLAQMAGGIPPVHTSAPVAASSGVSAEEDDTKTRRTTKIQPMNVGRAVRPMMVDAAQQATPGTVTPLGSKTDSRRTLKLSKVEGGVEEEVPSDDTRTRRTQRLSALSGMDQVQTPAEQVMTAGTAAPVSDDTRTRRTQRLSALSGMGAPIPAAAPVAAASSEEEDTRTRRTQKVTPVPTASKSSVDDTIKLQRPAPRKSAQPTVVPPPSADAAAPSAAKSGIKLNRPAAPEPPKKVAAPVAQAPETAQAEAAEAAAAEEEDDENAPRKRKNLTVRKDAVEGLGHAPIVDQSENEAKEEEKHRTTETGWYGSTRESTGIMAFYATISVFTLLLMVFVATVAFTDYFNFWQPGAISEERLEVPVLSEQVVVYQAARK